jgi:hypothetical protein
VDDSAALTQVGSELSATSLGLERPQREGRRTAAPDLIGATVDNVSTANTLDCIDDQNGQISTVNLAGFTAYYSDGTALAPWPATTW